MNDGPTGGHVPQRRERTDENIRIADLIALGTTVQNWRFVRCQLIGPAVLAPLGSTSFLNCSWEGTLDSVIWEIPDERPEVMGAVGVLDCEFLNCAFVAMGVAGPRSFVQQFKHGTTTVG